MAKSNYDILFITSRQFSRVSRYGTEITVAYFDHNTEWILEIIGRMGLCDLVMYAFVGPAKKKNCFIFIH